MEDTVLNLVDTAKQWIAGALEEAGHLWDAVLDKTAPLWVPLMELAAPMPDWMLALLLGGVLALALTLAWVLRSSPLKGEAVSVPEPGDGGGFVDQVMADPRPGSVGGGEDAAPASNPAPKITPLETAGEPDMSVPETQDEGPEEPPSPEPIPDIRAPLEGQLSEAVRIRLAALQASGPEVLALLDDARHSLEEGHVRDGVDFLVQLGDAEAQAAEQSEDRAVRATIAAADVLMLAGDIASEDGGHAEAMTLYRRALSSLGLQDPHRRVACLNRFGEAAYALGDGPAAAAAFTKAVQVLGAEGGDEAPGLSIVMNNLGLAHQMADQPKEAESAFRKALQLDEQALGPDHPDVAVAVNNLALLYKLKGVPQAAEPLFRRAVRLKAMAHTPPDPKVSIAMRNLAALLRETGREDEARTLDAQAAGDLPFVPEEVAPASPPRGRSRPKTPTPAPAPAP